MARRIEGTIYRLTYTATWHDYVECSSKEDLFKYVAQEVVNGQIVTSVNEMCKDGSTPKVKVHTDKDFKRILKQYQNPPEVRMQETYWTNSNGCHYYLSPIDEKDFSVGQFSVDARSLAQARKEAKAWIKEKSSEYKIIVSEA